MYVIDIGYQTPDVTMGEQLAVLSCQGLMNRETLNENQIGWSPGTTKRAKYLAILPLQRLLIK